MELLQHFWAASFPACKCVNIVLKSNCKKGEKFVTGKLRREN